MLVLAPIFKGTGWTDPEFIPETKMPLGMHPQKLIGSCLLGMLVVALVCGSVALTN